MRKRRYTWSNWKKKRISESGTSIVEFALVSVVFFMVLFGIMEFGRLLLMYHYVGNAAREGTRYAIVNGSTSLIQNADNNAVADYVKSISPFDPNNVQVDTVWQNPADHKPDTWVRVTVTYPFRFILPFFFGSGIDLTSTSQMVISY